MSMSMMAEAGPPAKKRKLTVSTVNKWKEENDKTYNTSTWLTFEKLDQDHVASLKCSVRTKFEEKLHSCRNHNPAFIVGTKNLRASAVKEHATTEMHKLSMILLAKSRSSDVTQYTPIAKALSTLDHDSESKLRRKFEVAYFLSKEGLAFAKMAAVCELEQKHVQSGFGVGVQE